MFRRVASNRVVVNGKEYRQCVVEVQDGIVVNYYTFTDELPLTEWIGGLIDVKRDEEGILRAYWGGKPLQ
ncbi:MAG: hypothetical protein Q4D41_01900 [Prevotellaceae bacterium]|nr:hypothetical protein [Prevotellaceae bacterium]